ncbi:MAG: hypothetical protein JW976_08795 [Syntrophaceae bacterium]|nr:hypothetical protein [Syntrophaceae bacterium]
MKKILFIVLVVILFASPVISNAETKVEPSPELKVADALFVRPPCAIFSVISTATFLVIVIPAHIIGISEPLAEWMVYAPWRFTGGRYLGEFNRCKSGKPIVDPEEGKF